MTLVDAFIASNVLIAFGYLALATLIVPRYELPVFVRASFGVYFMLCGAGHVDLAVHAIRLEPGPWGEPHMAWIHVPQAVAVWVAVLSALRFVSIRLASQRDGGAGGRPDELRRGDEQ